MARPRIFLGSSGKQAAFLDALTNGLGDVADVEPWTIVFNPGSTTLGRLVELTRDVDFAAFIFGQDDWTSTDPTPAGGTAQASPRDNVVFEAGLFGGVLGMERTFILHANGAKLPTDLLGLTSVRYADSDDPAEVDVVLAKLRKAIEDLGSSSRIEGLWWQFSQTARTELEPSAVSLLSISRDRGGMLQVNGRGWQEDGTLSVRYWSEAARADRDPVGVFYMWQGERPRDPNAPALYGTGAIRLEGPDRATGYWITRSETEVGLNAKTSGVYLRADATDLDVLDGRDNQARADLIAARIDDWKSIGNS